MLQYFKMRGKDCVNTVPLYGLSLEELSKLLLSWGGPAFHAAQLWRWMYRSQADSFAAMTDLPASLRAGLSERASLFALTAVRRTPSATGDTNKVLFRLPDSQTIEAVSMRHGGRHTICVSTQAGCPVGCSFCATGLQGFRRNLAAGEIVEQVICLARMQPEQPVTNVVFMGMGEPLLNYDATLKAARILNSPQGFALGARRMTISTAGVVPGIRRLAKEELQVGLAVSLHAATDALRDGMVPLNRRYPLRDVVAACREYFTATGRRVSFEYALFAGVNDSARHARELAKLIAKMNCHVNLIPANRTCGSVFQPPTPATVKAFLGELQHHGITATVRRSLGTDVDAGCGQLRERESAGRPAPAMRVKTPA